MANISLQSRFRNAQRRTWMIGSVGATAWATAAAVVLLLAAAWLDLLWELSPGCRLAVPGVAVAIAAVLLGLLIRRIFDVAAHARIARRMDAVADSGGQILTGWELDAPSPLAPQADLSSGLAQLAVERAAGLAQAVPLARVAPVRDLRRPLAALALIAVAVGLLAVCLPRLASTEWSRFLDPWADVPPFSPTQIDVTPGAVAVVYGAALDIYAAVSGQPADQLELVLEGPAGPEPPLPMFPEPDGRWRAVLAKVTEPATYYVRAYRARSERYQITVVTVPQIVSSRLRIEPPAYTRQAAYEGPLPKDGVAGLPGTRVRIWVRSNRPLSGGRLVLTGQQSQNEDRHLATNRSAGKGQHALGASPHFGIGPEERTMEPTAPGSDEVSGQFAIGGDGKFECRVTDEAGQASQQSFAGAVHLLADERPFLRIVRPEEMALATPTVALPVELWAEDDYGVSRVQLFRSLNDSRPSPMELPVPSPPARRVPVVVYLPLEQYGVEPGDEIKLFGRVEDNDPAGAKGAESTVVTVRIISQEEFERMLRVRAGLEVLTSKYREAQRRMEGLADEVEGLRKKLKDLPPDSPVAQETRRQMERVLQRLQRESEALRKLARHKLPFDLDEHLRPHVEQLISLTDEMAQELEKLLKQQDLLSGALAGKLEKMARALAGRRDEYAHLAMEPLEHLEEVFPLMADQQRFTLLALRQKDLAERMASLKGHDGEDDPSLKARMRDLEKEQRDIREALDELLGDIDNHVERLPAKPEFEDLRTSATEFVKAVRASGAAQALADAEGALADFSGTRAHAKAKEAAEILDKFVKKCAGGMGDMAGRCLMFQPALAQMLGDTVAQLLAQMSGDGGGGYGLYGVMAGMDSGGSGLYGENDGRRGRGRGHAPTQRHEGRSPDEASLNEQAAPGTAAGVGEGAVPIRYRRQVGQYFQRITEEVGEK